MEHTTSANGAYEILMDKHQPLFESVLLNAASSAHGWAHRIKTFESLGLLDFLSACQLTPKPVFDQFVDDENGDRIYFFGEKQLDEPKWHHRLLRKLKARRPSKFTRHRLQLDCDQVKDDKYRQDIAKVLAYKWVLNLEPGHMDTMFMKLMELMNLPALEHCLDTFGINDISTKNISSFLLRRLTIELLDKNEKFEARLSHMKERMALVQERATEDIRRRCNEILHNSITAGDIILSETLAECDVAIAANRNRIPADTALYARALAERGIQDDDAQESFRRAVDRRMARRKAARKRLARMRRRHPAGLCFWIASRLALVGGILLVASVLKVGGVTLAEFIGRLLN